MATHSNLSANLNRLPVLGVLDCIVSYLPDPSLQTMRQVSRFWNKIALYVFIKQAEKNERATEDAVFERMTLLVKKWLLNSCCGTAPHSLRGIPATLEMRVRFINPHNQTGSTQFIEKLKFDSVYFASVVVSMEGVDCVFNPSCSQNLCSKEIFFNEKIKVKAEGGSGVEQRVNLMPNESVEPFSSFQKEVFLDFSLKAERVLVPAHRGEVSGFAQSSEWGPRISQAIRSGREAAEAQLGGPIYLDWESDEEV